MYPQVLLLGNGLNRTIENNNWTDLIDSLHCNPKANKSSIKSAPFPLQAVIATGDMLEKQIKDKHSAFFGLREAKEIEQLRPMMERILTIPFDHILTTNYSYEVERIANAKVGADGEYCKHLARNSIAGKRVEPKYLLHTYNEVSFENHCHKVWYVHGEARKQQSIVLGHYNYGSLFGKIHAEVENRKNSQLIRQRSGEGIIEKSWVDAFIMGDVFVLGFGYDYSEFDLWWLLDRKKRESAEHGKVYFYEAAEGNELKHSLLNAYGVCVESFDYYTKPEDYNAFYSEAIDDIRKKIEAAQKMV